MLANPLESILDITKRITAPVLVDGVCKSLAVTGRSSDVGRNNNKALLSKDGRVPPGRPAVTPSTLRTTVDEVRHWVLFRIVEVARSDDPGMDLLCHLWVAGWCPDR